MDIQSWPLKTIKPYEGNPRTISADAISKVANSIRTFGFLQPIVVDAEGVIIVGHTRYLAAKKLRRREAPVVVADKLSPEQVHAYRIADNKTGELSEWDEEKLLAELGILQGFESDLSVLGFENDELLRLMGDDALANSPEPNVDAEKSRLLDLLTVTIDPPTHEVLDGDVYLIGERHHLLCVSVMTGWPTWAPLLDHEGAVFCPYPGPFVTYGKFPEKHKLVMVQPDPYTCGHILDRYEECFPGGIEKVTL